MSNSIDRLVYMANQIARNLANHHHPEEAVADHIASFWDPRMKGMIREHVQAGGADLEPIAFAAVAGLSAYGAPDHQSDATRFNKVDEAGGSDAG